LSDLSHYRRFSPKIILLVTLIVVILVAVFSIIIVNTIVHEWGIYEIFTSIGVAFIIVGGLLAVILFNAGTRGSSTYMHAMYPKMAQIESEYARKQRQKFPWLSILLIIIGGIFLAIGLVGVY